LGLRRIDRWRSLTLDHLLRWVPVGPLGHARDFLRAGPGEALAADPDAVAQGLAVSEHEVEVGVRRIDQDRAGRLLGDVIDQRSTQLRWQLLARAGLWLILGRKGGIARIDIIILRAYLAALDCERDKQGRDQAGRA
jgi:hypothetical protein